MVFELTHTNANRGTRTYKAENGLIVYLPKAAGAQPESFSIEGLNPPTRATARVAKAKMTPEERKAAAAERRAKNANLTPAQKLEAEEKRLAERKEALERRKAALANGGASATA